MTHLHISTAKEDPQQNQRSFCGDATRMGAGLVQLPPMVASLGGGGKKTRPCVSAGSMLSITPQAFWHHSHRLLWFVVMCRVYQHQHGGEDKEPRSSVRALDWGDGQTKLQSIGTLGREEMLRVAFFFRASMSMCAGVVCL
jgi:hypothetical protein